MGSGNRFWTKISTYGLGDFLGAGFKDLGETVGAYACGSLGSWTE